MTGSAAQRDVLELTLIEAALRDGQVSLARELLEPRLARKPGSAQIRAAARAMPRTMSGCAERPT